MTIVSLLEEAVNFLKEYLRLLLGNIMTAIKTLSHHRASRHILPFLFRVIAFLDDSALAP